MSEQTERRQRVGGLSLACSTGDVASAHALVDSLGDPRTGARLLDLWAWQEAQDRGLELLTGQGADLRWHSVPLFESAAYPALGHRSAAATWLESDLRARGLGDPQTITEPIPDRSLQPADGLLADAQGPGLFTIPFGPIRSGVVEALRYDVATAGEDMIRVAVRPGSKHRALESRATAVPLRLLPEVAERVAGVYSASVASAVCRAVEAAAGVEVAPEAESVRVALVELERLFNHLDVIMKLCDDASLTVGVAQVGMLKERVLRLLAEAVGHRYGRGIVAFGGVRRGVDWGVLARLLPGFARDLRRVQRRLLRTNSFLDRLQRTGRVPAESLAALGASGPLARGSELRWDARAERGWAAYQTLEFEPAVMDDGDVMARFEVRLAELRTSLRLLGELAERQAEPPPPLAVEPEPGARGVGSVETPEGEWLVSVEMGEEGRLRRCRIRPASLLNFACFEVACRGWVLTDFAFIEHSLGLSVAGRDR